MIYYREALTLCCPIPGHRDHSSSLNDRANTVLTRYEQSGRIEDLEEVITFYREALTLRLPCHPDRSSSLNDLAVAICARYEHSGKMEDLKEATLGWIYY